VVPFFPFVFILHRPQFTIRRCTSEYKIKYIWQRAGRKEGRFVVNYASIINVYNVDVSTSRAPVMVVRAFVCGCVSTEKERGRKWKKGDERGETNPGIVLLIVRQPPSQQKVLSSSSSHQPWFRKLGGEESGSLNKAKKEGSALDPMIRNPVQMKSVSMQRQRVSSGGWKVRENEEEDGKMRSFILKEREGGKC
jgi:hypothetical protein